MVMAGVDLATVQEIMRHKTIAMTLRYAHLSPEHKDRQWMPCRTRWPETREKALKRKR